MSFISFLLQTQPTGTTQAGGGLGMLVPMLIIILIMYFLMIRPQQKKQKETQKMIAALKKGDKVVTIGGIHGTISSTKETTVIVKVDDGAKIEFNRTAIATVIVDKPAAEVKEEKAEKKSLFGKKAKAVKESDATEAEVKESGDKKDE